MPQKASLIDWIKVLRLRTLPLSLASVFMGIGLAYSCGARTPWVWLWAAICVLCLQILSNIANDYGDGVKGTDNAERLGPQRGVQSGIISPKQMRRAMWIAILLSLASGLMLLYISPISLYVKLIFLGLGIVAIMAAIFYTVGKKAYGYFGMGDLFVMIFFGWIAILGILFLSALTWQAIWLLPATAMGAFSMAVLNLNNMRDIDNDNTSGKRTIAVVLGLQRAKYYHFGIISLAWTCMLCFSIGMSVWIYMIETVFAFLFFIDIWHIFKEKEARSLDKYLKRTALFTLAFVVLFWGTYFSKIN